MRRRKIILETKRFHLEKEAGIKNKKTDEYTDESNYILAFKMKIKGQVRWLTPVIPAL